jgi:GNAT-family acetyltransferase (TIGR03103 family)
MTDRHGPDDISTRSWREAPSHVAEAMGRDVVVDMGWGRVLFGQTFRSPEAVVDLLRDEAEGRRDICLYPRDPHVLVAQAPQEVFVDPSYTYRFWLDGDLPGHRPVPGLTVRPVATRQDADAIRRIYLRCGMVPAPADVVWRNQHADHVTYLVADDARSGEVIGTVAGIDHVAAFDDPEQGASLWTLAVDPASPVPGVGDALVRGLLARYREDGRSYLDLSVMHDNEPAIALYEKLGFERVPVFAVKRKNAINERLFAGEHEGLDDLNPYARIVAQEALRRGIAVEVVDARAGEMRLSHGGRSLVTRESLSELTTAVAMSRCDDKRHTRRILARAGLPVAAGRDATFDHGDHEFLAEVGEVVVKPARGEQGAGITVGVTTGDELDAALAVARSHCPDVVIEQRVVGDDLRIVVIGGAVVAAAVRRPAAVVGTGKHTIRDLVEAQSRRRAAATGGESTIPLDDETARTVEAAGRTLDDVLDDGEELTVRGTANLHTGGTIHDVTGSLHPGLARAAVAAADAIGIPVTGLDMIVPRPDGPDGVFIEANERPGLANHEPQPTVERFVDLLFPATQALPWRRPADGDGGAPRGG